MEKKGPTGNWGKLGGAKNVIAKGGGFSRMKTTGKTKAKGGGFVAEAAAEAPAPDE